MDDEILTLTESKRHGKFADGIQRHLYEISSLFIPSLLSARLHFVGGDSDLDATARLRRRQLGCGFWVVQLDGGAISEPSGLFVADDWGDGRERLFARGSGQYYHSRGQSDARL